MPILRDYAREKRKRFFLDHLVSGQRVLEVGAGEGWTREYLQTARGVNDYTSLDLFPPADIVGDITKWRALDLKASSFDVIIAFEVVEHVECFDDCYQLLKDGGKLMLTTPVPHMDWVMKILEGLNLNQKRTSPHSNLVYVKKVPGFSRCELVNLFGISQWAILTK
jgi:cyclopropane fatty-acyl-phospholipid synthase-like methyltransferase